MSELDELVVKRRSIRRYKTELPPAEWITAMLKCAAKAPSPTNSRPVRFVGIKSPEVRKALYEAMYKQYEVFLDVAKTCEKPRRKINVIKAYWRYSTFLRQAPLLFAIGSLRDVTGFSKRLLDAGIIEQDSRMDTDLDITIGLALKGFLLKGVELGLGTCILTAPLVFIKNVNEILGLSDIDVKCLVTVGFPDENPYYVEKLTPDELYTEI